MNKKIVKLLYCPFGLIALIIIAINQQQNIDLSLIPFIHQNKPITDSLTFDKYFA